MSESKFPIYCESLSGKSFYRIDSVSDMTEYQLIGSRYSIYTVTARILPERNLLADMIENHDGVYPRITRETFEKRVENCERNLQRIG